jgi:hypothetical protein
MAIFHPVDQRSEAWKELRLGMPTASRFGDIITPKGEARTGETVKKYLCELVAERVLRTPVEKWQSYWMQRGAELESTALAAFAEHKKVQVGPGGFMTTDDGKFGCSPDGIVTSVTNLLRPNTLEGVEVKVPSPQTHIYYLIYGLGENYVQQVQGQMWIGGFDVMHFYSWNPDLPPLHIETYRDEEFIKRMVAHLTNFHEELVERTMQVKEARDEYYDILPIPGPSIEEERPF